MLHLHRAIARKVEVDFESEVARPALNSRWLKQWDHVLAEYDQAAVLVLLTGESGGHAG